MKTRPWLLVILGFLASMVFDIACPRHAEADVAVKSGGAATWVVTFDAHEKNVGVQLTTRCFTGTKAHPPQTGYWQVEPEWTEIRVPKIQAPRGDRCLVVAYVFRNPAGAVGNPDDDYVGEASFYVQQ